MASTQNTMSSFDWIVITLIILYIFGELLAMQAGKLSSSRQLRKLSGRKSFGGGRASASARGSAYGQRGSAIARGSFFVRESTNAKQEDSNFEDIAEEETVPQFEARSKTPIEEAPFNETVAAEEPKLTPKSMEKISTNKSNQIIPIDINSATETLEAVVEKPVEIIAEPKLKSELVIGVTETDNIPGGQSNTSNAVIGKSDTSQGPEGRSKSTAGNICEAPKCGKAFKMKASLRNHQKDCPIFEEWQSGNDSSGAE